MPKPDQIWLYRITHVDNLPHILRHGLVVAGHLQADPGFRSIGDSSLIDVRKDLDAPDPPGGKYSEYVVKGQVPVSCFAYILVFDEPTQQKVLTWQRMYGVDIPVRISKQAYYDHL